MPEIVVLTGWRGAGKTAFCTSLAESARRMGYSIEGLICPARLINGIKTGIQLQHLPSGLIRLLASNQTEELKGFKIGQWTFDDACYQWGAELLNHASACDVFILDELGPLEFEQERGWVAGFDVLNARRYQLALIVVRPEFLAEFIQRYPDAHRIEICAGKKVNEIIEALLEKYLSH